LLHEILFRVVDGFKNFSLLTVAFDDIKAMTTTSITIQRAMN
jgi:hypothetical protein